MADYIVSARKYRPRTFEEVIGQSHITTTLTNAIKNQQLAHAMLFCGPRGIGKTTCARILAKTINEFDDSALEGSGMALNIFELDGASNNSVDDIRSLIDQIRYPPQQGKFKVYIIDEVHMLSKGAFNAFLKTLEEPPSYAIFILATTEKNKVLPTILSRCQIFDFNRIDVPEIEQHLEKIGKKENIETEKGALHLIAQKSDGSVRDALSLFDQLVAFSGNNKLSYEQVLKNLHILDYDYYLKLTKHLNGSDHESAVLLYDEILAKGFDGLQLVVGFLEHLRNLLMLQASATSKLVQVPENALKEYEEQSKAVDRSLILSWISSLQACEQQYRLSENQKLLVELTLVRMAYIPEVLGLGEPEIGEPKKKTPEKPVENKRESEEKQMDASEELPAEETERVEEEIKESKAEEIRTPSPGSGRQELPEIKEEKKEEKPKIASWRKEDPKTKAEEEKPTKAKVIPRIDPMSLEEEGKDEGSEPDLLQLNKDIPEDQEFSESDLKKAWKDFFEQNKAEFTPALQRILERKPELQGSDVVFKLGNPIEENHLNKVKAELNFFLKKSLRNKKVELKLEQVEEKEEKKPYTSLEKFNFLAEKNPALSKLKDDLGLELEY